MLPLLGLRIYHSLDFEPQIGGGEAFAVRDAGDDNPGSKIDAEAGRRVLIRRFLPMAFFSLWRVLPNFSDCLRFFIEFGVLKA